LIDYGELSATTPVSRTTTLSVSSPEKGYEVFGSEDHPLLSSTNVAIPDTSCDNGACSEITESVWADTLTYGFGYRCDNRNGQNCPNEFSEIDGYKQFASLSSNELPQTLMVSHKPGNNNQVKITYKLNISGTQAAGAYKNTITYIATPGF
jgi:hypothetical protein